MCDELGDEAAMQAYVVDASGASLCNVAHPTISCSEKEQAFVAKMKETAPDALASQLERLGNMKDSKLTAEAKAWIGQRMAIIKQISAAAGASEPEL